MFRVRGTGGKHGVFDFGYAQWCRKVVKSGGGGGAAPPCPPSLTPLMQRILRTYVKYSLNTNLPTPSE